MKLPVILERDETGMIVAECPAIPGCVSQGQTEQEAIANIREAIIGCLEVRAAQGLPLTRSSVLAPYARTSVHVTRKPQRGNEEACSAR